jgi:hypothetical protein
MLRDVFSSSLVDDLEAVYRGSEFKFFPDVINKPDRIVDWSAFSDLVSFREFPHGEILMAKSGAGAYNPIRPKNTFRKPLSFETEELGLPSTFSGLARNGFTLAVNAMQRHHVPVGRLCFELMGLLATKVTSNCYASWAALSPFDIHWDGHDVLVLQMEGSKHWAVYGLASNLIERTAKSDTSEVPEKPLWERTLRKGDALYVPRGWWHKAVTADEPSLHLTIGIRRRTYLDLLNVVATRLRENPSMSRSLPPVQDDDALQLLLNDLREGVEGATTSVQLRDVEAEQWKTFPFRKSISLPYIGQSSADNGEVSLQPFISIEDGCDCCVLTNGEKRWGLPSPIGQLLQQTKTQVVTIGDIFATARSSGVDQERARRIVVDLLDSGLISLSKPQSRSAEAAAIA